MKPINFSPRIRYPTCTYVNLTYLFKYPRVHKLALHGAGGVGDDVKAIGNIGAEKTITNEDSKNDMEIL